jgi:nucleotide-binding universal stress UspA family protein
MIMAPYRHILAPTDFSEPSSQAVGAAIDLAVAFGAGLTLMHTVETPSYAYMGMPYMSIPVDLLTPIEDTARSLLSSALEAARKRVPGATAELRRGSSWQQILAVAAEVGADLIVMGTHGRSGITHALLGSVTEKVVRHSPVPVLTFRTPAR